MRDPDLLRSAIREASRRAFSAVRAAHPDEHFYYFALVTTGDGLRPGPSASSVEGLERTLNQYQARGDALSQRDLRWSEADSPYNLFGDEFFDQVDALFLAGGDHRDLPEDEFIEEVERRYETMEAALRDLDHEGFFGSGSKRAAVVVNVVAPGDEPENDILERAARLNPPESLDQLRTDLGDAT